MPTVAELAKLAGAAVTGDGSVMIERLSAVDDASSGSLTFAVDERWLAKALRSRASAVLVPATVDGPQPKGKALIVAADVRAALAVILSHFAPSMRSGKYRDPAAVVHARARGAEDAWIGPGVIVDEDAELGAGCVLLAGAYVGRSARIGKRALLHPRASVLDRCIIGDDCILQAGCVIGSDGFGFVRVDKEQIKIPQIGNVVIGDRVEIGAGTTVDRALTGSTLIGSGTKIDNLVQIAHNVQIGEDCTICGQAGVAGSARIGGGVTIAGQAGVAGHIEIGERALILGGAKVTHSLAPNARVSGYPAQPYREDMAQKVMLRKLPKLVEQMRALAKEIESLRNSR